MSTGGPDGSCSAWALGNNNRRRRNSTEGGEGVPISGFNVTSNSSQGPAAMQTASIATPFAYTYQQLPSVFPPQQQQQMIHTQPLQQFQRPPPFHHQQSLHSSTQRLPHSQSNRHVPQETLELHQQVLHQHLLSHQQRQPQPGTSSGTTLSDSMEMQSHRSVPRSTTSVIAGPITAPLASPFDTDQSRAVVTFAQDVLLPQGIFPHATVAQQSATPSTSILGSSLQQHAASQAASYLHHYHQHFHQSSQSYPASPMTPFAPMAPFDRRLSSASMFPTSASPTPSSSSSKSSTSLQQQQQQQSSSSGHPESSGSQSLAPTGFKTTSTSPSEKGHIRSVPLSVAPDRSFSTEGDHMKLTDITRDNALAKEFLKSFRLRNERSNEGEAACDFCRKRKIRCNREKPSCSTCKERGVQCKKSDVLRKRGPPTKAERAKLAEAGFKYNSEERRSRKIRDREESVVSSSSTPGINSNSGSSSQSKAADVFGFTATSPSSASSSSSFTPLTGIRTNEGRPGGIGSAGALSAELDQTSHSSSPSLLSFDSHFLSLVSPTSLTPSASSTGSLASWVATPHQVGLDRRDENVSEQNLNAYLNNLHHQQVREEDRDAHNNRFGSARGEGPQ